VGLIKKSSIGAFLPLVILAFRLRIYYNMEDILLGQPNKCDSFCVISSAIAIPA
jgi:hypothetical protein